MVISLLLEYGLFSLACLIRLLRLDLTDDKRQDNTYNDAHNTGKIENRNVYRFTHNLQ